MKLDDKVISILEKFCVLNNNLWVEPLKNQTILRTINSSQTVMAEANLNWLIDDKPIKFPCEFGIYDLPKFIGILKQMPGADLDITSQVIKIIKDGQVLSYRCASKNTLQTIDYNKGLNFGEGLVNLKLDANAFRNLDKIGNLLQSPKFIIESNGHKCSIVLENDVDRYVYDLHWENSLQSNKEFRIVLKREKITFYDGDYDIEINSKKYVKWTGPLITYWMGAEKESTIES